MGRTRAQQIGVNNGNNTEMRSFYLPSAGMSEEKTFNFQTRKFGSYCFILNFVDPSKVESDLTGVTQKLLEKDCGVPISEDGIYHYSATGKRLDVVSSRYMLKQPGKPSSLIKSLNELKGLLRRSRYVIKNPYWLISFHNAIDILTNKHVPSVQQRLHMDFVGMPRYIHKVSDYDFPYSLLVAMQAGTTIYIRGVGTVPIPTGSCLVMRGNVVHAGSAYTKADNIRYHMFIHHIDYKEPLGREVAWVPQQLSPRIKLSKKKSNPILSADIQLDSAIEKPVVMRNGKIKPTPIRSAKQPLTKRSAIVRGCKLPTVEREEMEA